jgi:peptidoglycan/LPS O-acetylase OafA/YrhL
LIRPKIKSNQCTYFLTFKKSYLEHKAEYLSNLTPLRGIAALLVAIFHFEMAIARFIPANLTMFFEKSYLMVDLFFIMSGFIICMFIKKILQIT